MEREDVAAALADIDQVLSRDLSTFPDFAKELDLLRGFVSELSALDDSQVKNVEGRALACLVDSTVVQLQLEIIKGFAPDDVKESPLAKWLEFPWRAAWDEEAANPA